MKHDRFVRGLYHAIFWGWLACLFLISSTPKSSPVRKFYWIVFLMVWVVVPLAGVVWLRITDRELTWRGAFDVVLSGRNCKSADLPRKEGTNRTGPWLRCLIGLMLIMVAVNVHFLSRTHQQAALRFILAVGWATFAFVFSLGYPVPKSVPWGRTSVTICAIILASLICLHHPKGTPPARLYSATFLVALVTQAVFLEVTKRRPDSEFARYGPWWQMVASSFVLVTAGLLHIARIPGW
jgi:uncharacterized membrane protein